MKLTELVCTKLYKIVIHFENFPIREQFSKDTIDIIAKKTQIEQKMYKKYLVQPLTSRLNSNFTISTIAYWICRL